MVEKRRITGLRKLEKTYQAAELFEHLRQSFQEELIEYHIDSKLKELFDKLNQFKDGKSNETDSESLIHFTAIIDCITDEIKDIERIKQLLLRFISK